MKTITLKVAHNILNKNPKIDVYGSYLAGNLESNIRKVENKAELVLAVKAAEKASGILELREHLESLAYELSFWDTAKRSLYYKENIPKEVAETAKDEYKKLVGERDLIQDQIEQLLEVVYLEQD